MPTNSRRRSGPDEVGHDGVAERLELGPAEPHAIGHYGATANVRRRCPPSAPATRDDRCRCCPTRPPPDTAAAPCGGRDDVLDELLALVRGAAAGHGAARTVVGEAGIGKTTLLDAVTAGAIDEGVRVIRLRGVEAEVELAWSGLAGLLDGMLDRLDHLTPGRAAAIRSALALEGGTAEVQPFAIAVASRDLLVDAADAVADRRRHRRSAVDRPVDAAGAGLRRRPPGGRAGGDDLVTTTRASTPAPTPVRRSSWRRWPTPTPTRCSSAPACRARPPAPR